MFRITSRTIVCLVLGAGLIAGCQKEEKFTFPENPIPWSPDLSPSGAGGGGSPGGRPRRPQPSEAEQPDNQTAEQNQAAEGDQSSEATNRSNEVDDEIKSGAENDQQATDNTDADTDNHRE